MTTLQQPDSRVSEAIAAARGAPMDVAARAPRVLAALGSEADALLVTDLLNIRYLTGFTGGAGLMAVAPGGLTLVTDGRYGERAAADLAASGVAASLEVTGEGQRDAIAAAMGDASRIALEAATVSWADQRQYSAEWFPGKDLVPTNGLVERLRQVKDAGEIARIRAAVVLADATLAVTAPALMDRPTEQEFQWLLEDTMRAWGSEQPAFPTIVASGPNGSLPHHRPGDRTISEGDLVLIDFGGTIDGYRSDVSRTYAVGEVPAEARAIHDLVREAQAAGVDAVKAGVPAVEVDAACRSIIAAAGRGDQFIHSTGHGVGLFIHEDPFLVGSSSDVLKAGNVVSVEPGVYVPGFGGVRIEDLVVVTETGCEVLTQADKSAAPM